MASEPGSANAFLLGAFQAWLKAEPGVELQLIRDETYLGLHLVPTREDHQLAGRSIGLSEIPSRARTAGRKAMQKLLEEMRVGEE